MKTQIQKLKLVAIIGLIGSAVLAFYLDNCWLLTLSLAFIYMGNILRVKDENSVWNDGICEKYGEPWEFVDVVDYLETSDVYFECKDQCFAASPRDLFRNTYKGKTEWGKIKAKK